MSSYVSFIDNQSRYCVAIVDSQTPIWLVHQSLLKLSFQDNQYPAQLNLLGMGKLEWDTKVKRYYTRPLDFNLPWLQRHPYDNDAKMLTHMIQDQNVFHFVQYPDNHHSVRHHNICLILNEYLRENLSNVTILSEALGAGSFHALPESDGTLQIHHTGSSKQQNDKYDVTSHALFLMMNSIH